MIKFPGVEGGWGNFGVLNRMGSYILDEDDCCCENMLFGKELRIGASEESVVKVEKNSRLNIGTSCSARCCCLNFI